MCDSVRLLFFFFFLETVGEKLTSSSTRLARDGWPAARKRARTPRVPQGGREARAPQRRRYTAY